MADEITFSMSIDCENGELKPGQFRVSNLKIDQATQSSASGVQEIGTSEESLALPSGISLGSGDTLLIRNLDGTNFVQMGYATGTYVHRLKPQELPHVNVIDGTPTVYLKADTAACNVYWEYYKL